MTSLCLTSDIIIISKLKWSTEISKLLYIWHLSEFLTFKCLSKSIGLPFSIPFVNLFRWGPSLPIFHSLARIYLKTANLYSTSVSISNCFPLNLKKTFCRYNFSQSLINLMPFWLIHSLGHPGPNLICQNFFAASNFLLSSLIKYWNISSNCDTTESSKIAEYLAKASHIS